MKLIQIIIVVVVFLSPVRTFAQKRILTDSSIGLKEGLAELTGERRSICVSASSNPTDVAHDNISLEIDEVTNAESIYRSMETTASSQFGVGIGSKVSISFGMNNDQFFSRQASVLAINEKVITKSNVLPGPYTIAMPYKTYTDKTFKDQCGTGFVTEIVKGGEFSVLLRAENVSTGEKDKFRADLRVAIGSDEHSVAYQQSYERVTKNTSFQVHLIRAGGQGDLPDLTIKALIDYARTFPGLVRQSDNPRFVISTPYSAAGRIVNPDLSTQLREAVLYELAARFERALDLNKQINDVFERDPAYSFARKATELQKLQEAAQATASYVDATVASATSCIKFDGPCNISLLKPVPSANVPRLLSDVGGCYKWTDDNLYCRDYRKRGSGDSNMNYAAPMAAGTWIVRASGFVFPTTHPPGLGDITPITITLSLDALGKHTEQNRVFNFNDSPPFDISRADIISNQDGISGTVSVSQCFWVSPQLCGLDSVTLQITAVPVSPSILPAYQTSVSSKQ